MPHSISDEDAAEIQSAIFAGRKIEAIKKYRELTGQGLKESKEFVEAVEKDLRQESPERFTAPAGGKGCGVATVCLLILMGLAAAFA
jgi:mannitol-1-phosphate/altronate dehydrogenase